MKMKPQHPQEYLQKKKSDPGYRHILNSFYEIMKKEEFINCILKLRKKYHIPDEGFSKEDNIEYWEWSKKYNDELSKAVFNDIHKLTNKLHLPKEWWKAVMEALFHDSKDIDDLGFGTTSSLCAIEDLRNKKSKDYPVAIRISPYASERDILEFVKLTYANEIKPVQCKYKDEACLIGKIKSKNPDIKRRDDFIFKHRNLPRKVIVEMVYNIFKKELSDPIDAGSVGKIISREQKKRQNV